MRGRDALMTEMRDGGPIARELGCRGRACDALMDSIHDGRWRVTAPSQPPRHSHYNLARSCSISGACGLQPGSRTLPPRPSSSTIPSPVVFCQRCRLDPGGRVEHQLHCQLAHESVSSVGIRVAAPIVKKHLVAARRRGGQRGGV